MSKKLGKHLQFYMDCMKADCMMPSEGTSVIKGGLCRAADIGAISKESLKMFEYGNFPFHYWADEGPNHYDNRFVFNSLRQTIVLFMACLNGEL